MMKYRKLGQTGLKVSEISFGTIPITQGNVPVLPDYFNLSEDEAIEVMNYAFQLGCNLYDTAVVEEYGDAETKLGIFAEKIGREKIIISDKARFFEGNSLYKAVEQSIENLNTTIDIYFVHQVDEKNVDRVFEKYGALDALVELRSEGKIRFTGIASHFYSVLLRGAGDPRVDVLQGSGNIFERGMLERIEQNPVFNEKGIIINKVFAAGILPAFFSIEELISGVLSFPVSTALVGLGTKEQVDSSLGLHFDTYTIPSYNNVVSRLRKSFEPIMCTRCQKCKCIYGTQIHILFRQYNYYFLGKDYWALRKLDMGIAESAGLCKNCLEMTCKKMCPRNINIPDTIRKIHNLVKTHWSDKLFRKKT